MVGAKSSYMTNIWCEEELDSVHRSFQSESPDEEDGEDHVRQSGGDVHSLGGR